MANYSNLLATIAANIYTNGNNEVTASMVKAAVDAMVASLGAGYQFMGVAAPATTPGNADIKQFYIASTPGTYTNFSGVVVNDGEVAVLKYDTAWSKEVALAVNYDVKTSSSFVSFGSVAKNVGDDIYVIGTIPANTLCPYFGIFDNARLLLSYNVENVNISATIPPNIIVAAGGDYIYYWASTSVVKFNLATQQVTTLKTLVTLYSSGKIDYDPAVGITISKPDGSDPLVVLSDVELAAESARFAFGVSTDTQPKNTMKFSYVIGGQLILRQLGANSNGVNLRAIGATIVKPFIPAPVALFGDSIVSEYFVDPANNYLRTEKCVLAWYINENLGLGGVREVFTSRDTTSGESEVTDDYGDVVMYRRGYPDETFSNEHQHNSGCLQDRIAWLVALSPKSVVIMAGTNDFGYNCTIGDVDSTNPATTCGGLNIILQAIAENLPACRIYVCTPIPRATQFTPNTKGNILADYVDAIAEVARRYSAKVINLYDESGIYYANEVGAEHTFLIDGIHPNLAGFERMTRLISNGILESV